MVTIVESLVGTTVGFASLTALFIIRKIMLSTYCNKCKMNSSCQSDMGIISIKIERITPMEIPHENALDIPSSQTHSPEKIVYSDSFTKKIYIDRDRTLFNKELENRLNTVVPRMMKIQSVDGIDVTEEYVDENGSFSQQHGNRSPTRHYHRESSERLQHHDSENKVIERLNSVDHSENRTNLRSLNMRKTEVYAPEYNEQKSDSFSGSIRSSNMRKIEVYTQHSEYNEQKSTLSRRPSRSPTEHR